MKYSYNWLKEYALKIPEPKKLVELLTMRAFEVEEIDVYGKDTVLDIKVLPNRAFDCLSHIGMAREVAAITTSNFSAGGGSAFGGKLPTSKYKEDKSLNIKNFLKVDVKDKKLCPRYSARVVVDVKVGESPQWLKDRLAVCGLRPINNIVDVTNYVLLEYGQPLHAFDFDKCDANDTNKKNIIVRRAEKGEKIVTLEGEERELDENILVIADGKDPIAIAGIKGGKKAEIDNKTTRIILESANFEPISTRKSSRALNLRTDASIRFENGLDINLTIEALDRAAGMIAEIAGGKIVSGIADVQAVKPRKVSTAVAHSYVERLLGIEIKQKDILDIFKRLDLPVKIAKKKADIFYEVLVPSRRNDLNTPEDLIEEIGRLYGYENIPALMPTSILIPAVKNEELINEEKARNIMVGAGYSEVYNYSLVSDDQKTIFALTGVIGPKYPLSQDQKYLRPTLIMRLLENVEDNLKYFDTVRIFEIGKIFKREGESIKEKRMFAGGLYKKGAKENELFYEVKGMVDLFLEKMGIVGFSYSESIPVEEKDKAGMFYPKRARIVVKKKTIGWIGETNRCLLYANTWAFSSGKVIPVVIFELDFDAINELIEEEIAYRAPSKYPAIERDLSVVVDYDVKVDDVLNIIDNASGPLVINIDLEDIFGGEEMEEGKKSLTFRLVFQSSEKTLTDAEVNKIMEKVIKEVEESGWEIRK